MNYLVLHRSMRFAHDDKNYACLNNVSSPRQSLTRVDAFVSRRVGTVAR